MLGEDLGWGPCPLSRTSHWRNRRCCPRVPSSQSSHDEKVDAVAKAVNFATEYSMYMEVETMIAHENEREERRSPRLNLKYGEHYWVAWFSGDDEYACKIYYHRGPAAN